MARLDFHYVRSDGALPLPKRKKKSPEGSSLAGLDLRAGARPEKKREAYERLRRLKANPASAIRRNASLPGGRGRYKGA
jgi:hypothetical protein